MLATGHSKPEDFPAKGGNVTLKSDHQMYNIESHLNFPQLSGQLGSSSLALSCEGMSRDTTRS